MALWVLSAPPQTVLRSRALRFLSMPWVGVRNSYLSRKSKMRSTGLAIGVTQMAITKAVWKFMFRKHSLRIATLMFCAVSATAAAAMDRGQFKNVPPPIREWFENMRSPNGISCCSYADGHRTGYDIRQGQYWVPIDGDWYPVPPEAEIKTENPVGEAIVWYLHQAGPGGELPRSEWYRIVCFVPSGDV
jgi:hypothetical protein